MRQQYFYKNHTFRRIRFSVSDKEKVILVTFCQILHMSFSCFKVNMLCLICNFKHLTNDHISGVCKKDVKH